MKVPIQAALATGTVFIVKAAARMKKSLTDNFSSSGRLAFNFSRASIQSNYDNAFIEHVVFIAVETKM